MSAVTAEIVTRKVTPKNDNLLVQRREAEEMSEGGIVLPKMARRIPLEGTVIDAGSHEGDYPAGTVVLFGGYAGHEINVDDVDYMLLRVQDVLAVVERG